MLEVICGPMFSGKTEELIRRVNRLRLAHKEVFVFGPENDTRWSDKPHYLKSHGGYIVPSEPLALSGSGILDLPGRGEGRTIVVDEVQFFTDRFLSNLRVPLATGYDVILCGLDMTFRREPFGIVPNLLAMAQKVTKLTAVCFKCGKDAHYTQRLINGEPAPSDSPTVMIGATDIYEARCGGCYDS